MNKKQLFLLITTFGLSIFLCCASTPATMLGQSEQEMLSEIKQEKGERSSLIAAKLLHQIKAVKTKSGKQGAYDYLMQIGYRYPYECMMIRNTLFPDIPQTQSDNELTMLADIQLERGDRNALIAYKYLLQAKAFKLKTGKSGTIDYLNKVALHYPYEAKKLRETLFPEKATKKAKVRKSKPKTVKAKVDKSKPKTTIAKVENRVQKKASPSKKETHSTPGQEPPKPTPLPQTALGTTGKITQKSKFRKKFAVVIGISDYEYQGKEGLTNLLFADDDAIDFSSALKKVGWSSSHIKMLLNEKATKRNIQIALESWLTKAGENDLIVVFWAGHGFPDPEDQQKVYFACYDTELSIPATGYRMDRVRVSLEERGARNVLFFGDTCHAGKLVTRGKKENTMAVYLKAQRKKKKIPKGWIFMVGAATDRYALESSSWSNGAFTHCLVEGLRGKADGFESMGNKDGIVTMRELQGYMNTIMPEKTQKTFGVARRPLITTTTGDPTIWDLTLGE